MAATIAASAALASSVALYANSKLGITRDVRTLRDGRRFSKNLQAHIARQGASISLYRLLELADPNADAIWFEGKTYSYRAMKAEVDILAQGLQTLGVKDGDFVAIFMTNSPEMVLMCYALVKLGAAPALINSALRDDTLLHCVKLPAASLIISTPDLAPFAASAAQSLDQVIKVVSLNLGSFKTSITDAAPSTSNNNITLFPFPAPILSTPTTILPASKTLSSTACLIYTSGTTGKPKACTIKNHLIMATSCPSAADSANARKYLHLQSNNQQLLRTYSCMPIFHGTTFLTGVCYSVGTSGCFCISRKFSARNFWKECHESRATRMLYVGELCRFLLASKPGEYDRNHNVLVATGNGLQEDVWLAFQKRFGVPEIREYYRSTEGLVKYDNRHLGGRKGAGRVAHQGVLYRRQEKDQFIVRFDYDTELPYRDPQTGFCVVAPIGEPGEAVARIKNVALYPDYHNNAVATQGKILRDVFEKGDMFQRSGDLLVQESTNWVRFVDRIGDTFRWKGENVSAGEIRAYIADLPEVQDAVVVGKKLPGYDGQAGVVAINLGQDAPVELEEKFMKGLYGNLKRKGVPGYALPRLVIVTSEIAVGDTFKHAKQVVKSIVWEPVEHEENLPVGKTRGGKYWLDGEVYRLLDWQSWRNIEQGTAKL